MAGAPGFTRTWAPSREGAWSSRAAVSALPAMDLWTAAPQGPEEPRKAAKSTHAGARRVCPAGGTPPRPDGCSPIGVPESGSQSKGQRKEATCSARARSAAAQQGGGLCGSAPGTHSGPAGAPSSAGGGRLALPPHAPPSSSQASPGLSLAAGGGGHTIPPRLVSSQALSPKPRSSYPEPHCRQPRRPLRRLEPSPHPQLPQVPDTLLFRGVHSRPHQGGRPLHASFPELTWQSHPFLVPTWH